MGFAVRGDGSVSGCAAPDGANTKSTNRACADPSRREPRRQGPGPLKGSGVRQAGGQEGWADGWMGGMGAKCRAPVRGRGMGQAEARALGWDPRRAASRPKGVLCWVGWMDIPGAGDGGVAAAG